MDNHFKGHERMDSIGSTVENSNACSELQEFKFLNNIYIYHYLLVGNRRYSFKYYLLTRSMIFTCFR